MFGTSTKDFYWINSLDCKVNIFAVDVAYLQRTI